mmetsp:Transcript_923/g.2294  ORF Transcript_923/g.2294 Transcript_923/m.2294 type:complete len:131 (-) Transcript_923:54-446(-)
MAAAAKEATLGSAAPTATATADTEVVVVAVVVVATDTVFWYERRWKVPREDDAPLSNKRFGPLLELRMRDNGFPVVWVGTENACTPFGNGTTSSAITIQTETVAKSTLRAVVVAASSFMVAAERRRRRSN